MPAQGEKFPYEALAERWSAHYHARLVEAPIPVKAGALGLPGCFCGLICGGETERGQPAPGSLIRRRLTAENAEVCKTVS